MWGTPAVKAYVTTVQLRERVTGTRKLRAI
jgi:hypothetical protein